MTSRCFQGLIKVTLLLGAFGVQQMFCQTTTDLSVVEQNLVQDALKNINHQLSHKTGTLERISCCYKVVAEKPQSASIKTFYVDYRKKPDHKEYSFNNSNRNAPDQVIEIIYKAHEKKQLSIISKNPKKNNKRCGCKYVEIS